MNHTSLFFRLLIAAGVLIALGNCNNEEDDFEFDGIRIRTRTWGSVAEEFIYDSEGRLIKAHVVSPSGSHTATYTYGNNSVAYSSTESGIKLDYVLNSEGFAIERTVRDGDSIVGVNHYTYDNEGRKLSAGTNTFGWSDDNIVYSVHAGDTMRYTYFMDKLNTIGTENMGLGFLGKDSKNLISTYSGSHSVTYSYEYDAQGRVTKATASGITYNYTYY